MIDTLSVITQPTNTKKDISQVKLERKQFYANQLKCDFIIASGKKCSMTRVKHSNFCRWHTPKDITQSTPSPSSPTQSINTDVEDDLSFEISLLKNYLRKLINDAPTRKTLDPKYLKLQLQLIEQIRKLVHSLSIIESQSKVYSTVTKIINSIVGKVVTTIQKYNLDEDTKLILSNELREIANNQNEDDDLGKLLKSINPKHKYERLQ